MISIIIPAYNVEKYIDRCLDSITNQTYNNTEIIIINDGSIDKTKEKLESWRKKDKRIKVINKKNEGVSIARNDGIDISRGKYIFFFDGDDTVEINCIEKVISEICKQDYDTVLYGYSSVRNNQVLIHKSTFSKDKYFSNREVIEEVLPHSFGISYNELSFWLQGKRSIREGKELNGPWRMCYSAEIIKSNNIRFDKELKVGEDTIFTNEYLSYSSKLGIVNENLYYLHNNEGSTISTYLKDTLRMAENKKLLIKAKKDLSNKIKDRTDIDVDDYWGGEVVLSTVQLAWLLTDGYKNLSWMKRYKIYKDFINYEPIKSCWNKMTIKANLSVKSIPILLIKYRLNFTTFAIMSILRKLGMQINVG